MAGSDERFDLCVVGGGVAGAYVAAWAVEARPGWRIGLFERSGRIGGRLLSVSVPGANGARAELGGMRFRTSQPLITSVVKTLGLEMRPFRTVHDDNRFFLRGERWSAGEPAAAARAYRLAADESGLSPSELLVAAFERVVPQASELTDGDWLKIKRDYEWRGRPLREWSLEDVLAQVLTEEGHQYVLDGFGYATILAGRNAADAIPWILIEARPESENQTLVDGMERLPRELAGRFEHAGGEVHLNRELEAIEQDESSQLRLRLTGCADVLADTLVLALPKRALERVMRRSTTLVDSDLANLIGSVSEHGAAKLFLSYERPWWRAGGMDALRAVTDLRLSKIYYFDQPFGSAQVTSPLLLASYSDGPNREYWHALADGDRGHDDQPYASPQRWHSYAAAPAQVEEAQRQLRVAHRRDDIPSPVSSIFLDWGALHGAWHVWNPQVASWDVMSRILKPRPQLPIYVCGEAYSWSQGWVEGALETAQAVIDRLVD